MSDADGKVVPLTGFKRDPRQEISSVDWAKELCKTYLRTDPTLPEAAIERRIDQYSDEQMDAVAAGVMLFIEGTLKLFDVGKS